MDRLGEKSRAVFASLCPTDIDKISIEIEILYTEADTFHEPQPGTIKHFGHEQMSAGYMLHDSLHLWSCHNNGWPRVSFRLHRFDLLFDGPVEHMTIQKDDCIQRLPLCGSRNKAMRCKVA